jgi:hypothetical protein
MATLDEIQPRRVALKSRVIVEERVQMSSQYLCGKEGPDLKHIISELQLRDLHGNRLRGRELIDCGETSIVMRLRLVQQLRIPPELALN